MHTNILIISESPQGEPPLLPWLFLEQDHGYALTSASTLAAAAELLDAGSFDVILASPAALAISGFDIIKTLMPKLDMAALIVVLDDPDEGAELALLQAGAHDVLVKSHADPFQIRRAILYAIERRRNQLSLEQSQARFRDFANASSDWFWELDTDLRITYRSSSQRQVSSIDPFMVMSMTDEELSTLEYRDEWLKLIDTLKNRQPFSDFDYMSRGTDGSARYVRVSGVPYYGRQGVYKGYRGVARDITERKQLEDRISHMALFDGLTGLPNRAAFDDALQRAASAARRRESTVTLFYLDLDGFKAVNDTFGHAAGDTLLTAVGERLKACVRVEDVVARLGGDEFGIIASDLAATWPPALVAERLIQAVRQPYALDHGTANIATSIGIATFPTDSTRIEECVRLADGAMYASKRAGKGCFSFAK